MSLHRPDSLAGAGGLEVAYRSSTSWLVSAVPHICNDIIKSVFSDVRIHPWLWCFASVPVLRVTPRLSSHDGLVASHRWSSHSIWVHLRIVSLHGLLHKRTVQALLLRDGAIFVCQEECLEVDNLLSQL